MEAALRAPARYAGWLQAARWRRDGKGPGFSARPDCVARAAPRPAHRGMPKAAANRKWTVRKITIGLDAFAGTKRPPTVISALPETWPSRQKGTTGILYDRAEKGRSASRTWASVFFSARPMKTWPDQWTRAPQAKLRVQLQRPPSFSQRCLGATRSVVNENYCPGWP